MKKEIFKEIGCYIGCIAFIAGSAYFSGFYKKVSYQSFSDAVVSNVKATGIEEYINRERSPRKKVTAYKNYRPQIIPDDVLDGSISSRTWTNLFTSNKKVIFYVYDSNDDFHNRISSYYNQKALYKFYDFAPYKRNIYETMRYGEVGPSKICNSIEECNKVRTKAANYTLLTNFLNRCASSMCIFDSSKNQYIRLKNRNVNEAVKALDGLKNW